MKVFGMDIPSVKRGWWQIVFGHPVLRHFLRGIGFVPLSLFISASAMPEAVLCWTNYKALWGAICDSWLHKIKRHFLFSFKMKILPPTVILYFLMSSCTWFSKKIDWIFDFNFIVVSILARDFCSFYDITFTVTASALCNLSWVFLYTYHILIIWHLDDNEVNCLSHSHSIFMRLPICKQKFVLHRVPYAKQQSFYYIQTFSPQHQLPSWVWIHLEMPQNLNYKL